MPIAEYSVQAHRGGRDREVPENCIEAFRATVRDKTDGLELDAFVLADGVTGIFHGWARDMNNLTNVEECLNEFINEFIRDSAGINAALTNETFLTNDWPRIHEALVGNDFLRDKTWIQDLLRGTHVPGTDLTSVPFNGANVNLNGILQTGDLPPDFPNGLSDDEKGALKGLYLEHKHHPVDLRPFATSAQGIVAPGVQGAPPPAEFTATPGNLTLNQVNALRSLYLVSVTGADLSHATNIINGTPGGAPARDVQLTDFDMSIDDQRQALDALRHMYMEYDHNYLSNIDPNPERVLLEPTFNNTLATPPRPLNNVNGVDLTRFAAIVNPAPPGVSRVLDSLVDMNRDELMALVTLHAEANPPMLPDGITPNPTAYVVSPPGGTNLRHAHWRKLEDPKGQGILHTADFTSVEHGTLRLKNPAGVTTNHRMTSLPQVLDAVYDERSRDPFDDGKFVINVEVKERGLDCFQRNPANHPTAPFRVIRYPAGHLDPQGNPVGGQPIPIVRDIAQVIVAVTNNHIATITAARATAQGIAQANAIAAAQATGGLAATIGVVAPPVRLPEFTKEKSIQVTSFDNDILGRMNFRDPVIQRGKLTSGFTACDHRINPATQRVEYRDKQRIPAAGQPPFAPFTPGPWTDMRPLMHDGSATGGPTVLPQDELNPMTDQRVIDTLDNHADILRNPTHRQYAEKYAIVKDWVNDVDTTRVWDLPDNQMVAEMDATEAHITLDIHGTALVDPVTGGPVHPNPSFFSISAANATPAIAANIHARHTTVAGQVPGPGGALVPGLVPGPRRELANWTTNEMNPALHPPEKQRLFMETLDALQIKYFITDSAAGMMGLKKIREVQGLEQELLRTDRELIAAISAQQARTRQLLTYAQSTEGERGRRPIVAEIRDVIAGRQRLIDHVQHDVGVIENHLDSARVAVSPGEIPVPPAPQIPPRVGRRTDITTAPNTLLNPDLQPAQRARSLAASLVSIPKNIQTRVKNLKSQNFEQLDRDNVAAKLAGENGGVAVKVDEKKAKSNDTIVGRPFYVNSEGELFVKMPPPTGFLARIPRRPGNPLPTVIMRIKPEYHGLLTPEGKPDLHKLNELVSNADRLRLQNPAAPAANLDVTFKTHNVPLRGRGAGGGRGGAGG